jgi:hypothetical protein
MVMAAVVNEGCALQQKYVVFASMPKPQRGECVVEA